MANGFKIGGREAGTTNKRKAIGKRVEVFIDEQFDQLEVYIGGMNRKEKAEFLVKLLRYSYI